jgi:hypothetical protein
MGIAYKVSSARASNPSQKQKMKLHPEKTSRGWELADETGTFESESTSAVYSSLALAQEQADNFNRGEGRAWDELAALERRYD